KARRVKKDVLPAADVLPATDVLPVADVLPATDVLPAAGILPAAERLLSLARRFNALSLPKLLRGKQLQSPSRRSRRQNKAWGKAENNFSLLAGGAGVRIKTGVKAKPEPQVRTICIHPAHEVGDRH